VKGSFCGCNAAVKGIVASATPVLLLLQQKCFTCCCRLFNYKCQLTGKRGVFRINAETGWFRHQLPRNVVIVVVDSYFVG